MASHHIRSLAVGALLGVSLLGSLTACGGSGSGGGSDSKPDVASVDKSEGGGGKGGSKGEDAGDGEAGRPQIRLDTSDEEVERMWQAYFACAKENGMPMGKKTKPDGTSILAPSGNADKKTEKKIDANCDGKKPLQPPETDPEKNPDYMDDFRAWITCMNDKGMKVEGLSDGSGWNYTSDNQPANEAEISKDCEIEAFSG